MVGQTGAGRNQTTHNDVLLETPQIVALAHDGRLGQHPGGLLEGGRRNERVGRQRRFGDAQQDVVVGGRELAGSQRLVVLVEDLGAFDLFADDEPGVTRLHHLNPTQHLTHDDFDVLVVDLHALQTIDVLDLIDDIAGQRLDTQQSQDVVRIGRTVDDELALVDHLTVVNQDVLLFRDQEFKGIALKVGDDQTLLALGVLAKRHRTGDVGEHAGILGGTRFEELGHPRQTAGNVAILLRFLGNPGKHFTNADLLAIADHDQRAHREGDGDCVIGTGDSDFLSGFVDQLDLRTHALGGRATTLGIDHHQGRQTGDIVDLLGHRDAFFDVFEPHGTGVLGDHRACQRIPGRQDRTGLDDLAVAGLQHRAIRHLVTLALAAVVVLDQDFTGA